jgi:hypothetical protein
MAITPVHSSNDANVQAIQHTKPGKPSQPTASVPAPGAQAQNSQQPSAVQHFQSPKPVINVQGQKTGQIINATA